jgi:acetylornithine aminotransferase/acetylornithine/N-succinyldiaminopimelate aminotransferase
MLCTEEAARAFTPGMHGTTFGGNPLACAVAIAVIDEIKRSNLLDRNASTGDYLMLRLRDLQAKHPSIVDVRGFGLMIGVELDSDTLAKAILAGMMDRRILLNRTHETVLRFLPPFLITQDHVDEAIGALDELLTIHCSTKPSNRVLAGEPING